MKKLFLLGMPITLISATAFSQGPLHKKYKEPPVQDKAFYLEKAQKYNTAGGILLGTGTVLFVTGVFVYENNKDNSGWFSEFDAAPGVLAMVVGGGAIITSIPLFIVGGNKKKKAESMTVNFQGQKVPQLSGSSLALRYVPSLSLRINF
ncbi:MAG: hypothetical protein C5B59_20140 [Bacteroidetes bacterium]|nr:MAG: hypothetical protein C5B59_20140 [Bacteroidota bacterium]